MFGVPISSLTVLQQLRASLTISLLIGLTIVSLGTSAPEIVISVIASLSGSGELAVGNALGSNIANTGLVLGVTLIIKAMSVDAATTRRELPQMLGATLLAGALMIDGDLSVLDGLVLLSALTVFLVLLSKRDSGQDSELQEPASTLPALPGSSF